jgi:hypothetical protein
MKSFLRTHILRPPDCQVQAITPQEHDTLRSGITLLKSILCLQPCTLMCVYIRLPAATAVRCQGFWPPRHRKQSIWMWVQPVTVTVGIAAPCISLTSLLWVQWSAKVMSQLWARGFCSHIGWLGLSHTSGVVIVEYGALVGRWLPWYTVGNQLQCHFVHKIPTQTALESSPSLHDQKLAFTCLIYTSTEVGHELLILWGPLEDYFT